MNFVTSLFYRDFWTNGILAAVSENCVSPDLQMLRCNESWVISRVYFIVLIPEYSQTTSSYISDRHFAEREDLNSFRTTNQSYWDLDHADCVLAREPQTYFRSSLLFLRPEIRLRFAGYLCSRPCLSSYYRIIKSQYLSTNSPNGSPYISLKNELRELDKRSRHFLYGDHFINSYNLISWQCMDIVRRKLMLVTVGT